MIAGDKILQILIRHGILFESEMHIGAEIVDPDGFGLPLGAGRALVEEQPALFRGTGAAQYIAAIESVRDMLPHPESSAPVLHTQAKLGDILQALLEGRSASAMIREAHLMPTMAADAINEQMFDLIGDTVVSCENDQLSLVEDYREDLVSLLGGSPE